MHTVNQFTCPEFSPRQMEGWLQKTPTTLHIPGKFLSLDVYRMREAFREDDGGGGQASLISKMWLSLWAEGRGSSRIIVCLVLLLLARWDGRQLVLRMSIHCLLWLPVVLYKVQHNIQPISAHWHLWQEREQVSWPLMYTRKHMFSDSWCPLCFLSDHMGTDHG